MKNWETVNEKDARTLEELFDLIQSKGNGVFLEMNDTSEEGDPDDSMLMFVIPA